jgi:signal transduction histidine kinase
MVETASQDPRIPVYLNAIEKLKRGEYDVEIPADTSDSIGRLGQSLRELARALEASYFEIRKLSKITSQISSGILLDDILEQVYRDFREVIPYNRIGLALIDFDDQTVTARWAKSDLPQVKLHKGFTAPLAGSSLQSIVDTRQPRILNDLRAYLAKKPESNSTRLIVEEGIQSSLTCPLIANDIPIGFIFFSSAQVDTYADVHVETFQKVADQLSLIVEKGRLVSELLVQKQAIERQNEELNRLNELKNRFLGIAAHDLRSPLSVIQTTIDLLLGPDAHLYESENRSLLEAVGNQARHMLVLINDLLDYSEIEAGKLPLSYETIDVHSFLQSVIVDLDRTAASKNTEVLYEVSSMDKLLADKHRLRQVLENLISNAIKFSPPGSQIRVDVIREENQWRFNVRDQGPGIKPEEREMLFTPFARLSARPTAGEKSTGLGLAISRWVIEAHRGGIGVDSEPGKGSNFWFTIPDDIQERSSI